MILICLHVIRLIIIFIDVFWMILGWIESYQLKVNCCLIWKEFIILIILKNVNCRIFGC